MDRRKNKFDFQTSRHAGPINRRRKKLFMSYLPVIFSETPQSEVSALQLKLLFNKLPSEIRSLAKRLISDAISEGIRNILFSWYIQLTTYNLCIYQNHNYIFSLLPNNHT